MAKAQDWPKGQALIDEYRRRYGETTFLSFSRGKDSIGTALALRDKLNVVPVCYMDVPGLSFIEESLDYYERHLFKRHILRIAHPKLYDSFRNMLFQTPDTAQVCGAADISNRHIHRRLQGGQASGGHHPGLPDRDRPACRGLGAAQYVDPQARGHPAVIILMAADMELDQGRPRIGDLTLRHFAARRLFDVRPIIRRPASGLHHPIEARAA